MRKISIILVLILLASALSLPLDIQAFKMQKKMAALIEQDRSVATNMGLYGGKSTDIAIDTTSNRVYMTTMAPNGFFVSNDNGINWKGMSDSVNYGTGHAVEVDSSGNVYVSVGDDLLKSTDGSTFTEITKNLGSAGSPGEEMLVAQGKVLVGVNDGIALSSDNGASFTKVMIESGSQIKSLASSPTSGVFFAVASQNNSSEKLYQSTNGGASWSDFGFSAKTGVPASQRISTVGVNPSNANEIIISQTNGGSSNSLISIDGGNNWSQLKENGQEVASNHITYDSSGRLYMSRSWTTNRGSSWTQLNINTPASTLYSDSFAVDPADPNLIITNSGMGLARSADRGLSWIDAVSGVTSVKTYDITQSNNKQYVWVGADGGFGRTSNFTAAAPDWQYPILPGSQGSTGYAVWVSPTNPNIVVAGADSFVYRTTNAQAANPDDIVWTQVASAGNGGGNIIEIAQHPTNADILYAAHSNDDLAATDTGTVLKSTDGGATWANLNITGNYPVTSLTVARDGDVYAGTGGDASTGIYKYSGSTWTKLSGGLPASKISSVLADPENANNILATTESGELFRTTDAGITWTRITNGISKLNNLDSLTVQTSTSPNTFYMSGQDQSGGANSLNGVIYKSADGGQSWGEYYVGLKQETFYALLFDGLTAGNDRGLFNIKSKASITFKAKPKVAKKGKVVKLVIALKDAATKKKLTKRTVLLQKQIIVKKKAKGKWKRVAKWKLVKKVKLNKKGEASLKTKLGATTVFRVLWKPGNKADKAEYATSKSKNLKVKVRR